MSVSCGLLGIDLARARAGGTRRYEARPRAPRGRGEPWRRCRGWFGLRACGDPAHMLGRLSLVVVGRRPSFVGWSSVVVGGSVVPRLADVCLDYFADLRS